MGNLCTSRKTEESSFGFAFNNPKFSDRILRLETLPTDEDDDHDSDSNSNAKVRNLYTHSLLLTARSPFFRKLLNNGMKESQDNGTLTLKIKASEEAAVMDLLSFIYENPLKATSVAELLDVLIVADKYEVTCCITHCVHILDKFPMTVESALYYLEVPSMVFVSDKVKPLLDHAKKYLASHLKDFTKSKECAAMELPLSAIEAVLGVEELQVDSEDDVFDFALRWARLHYPRVEERREILTNCLAPLICFENMSSSKLKIVAGYPDFEHQRISELVINAFSSKVEAPYRRENTTCPRRLYKNRLVKVVNLELARCVVYFNLTKQDCADLVPSKNLCSQTFCLGEESFCLSAERSLEKDTLAIYVRKKGGCETCTLDVQLSMMNKLSNQFKALPSFVHVVRRDAGWGYRDPFRTPWKKLVEDESEYFINGIVHLRVDITFIE